MSSEEWRAGTDVVWMRSERPQRGPQPAHSRTEIVAAAIRIADSEGIGAASMRRVAAEVGAGTMSLYRYVTRKDDLFDLMVDAVLGEIDPTGEGSGDWRADLRLHALRLRAVGIRHTWLAELSAGRPSLGPNSLRTLEFALGAVDGLGLGIDEMLRMVGILTAFVRGFVQAELAEQEARGRTGLDRPHWQASQAVYVRSLVASGRYPMFTRVVMDAEHLDPDTGFRLALEQVLDGLEASLRETISGRSRGDDGGQSARS
jgi:AcrR family transcriptional regulator